MPGGRPQVMLRGMFAHSLAEAPAGMITDTAHTASPRPVIAIVDDDSAVCGALKFSLELEGFAVRTYHSGAEFAAAKNLDHCACFIIDQILPDSNGMQLIDDLRARRIAAPAILIVGHPYARLAAQAAAAGVPIVEKPLLGNALSAKIKEVCNIN
jgi:FixJ family two-component response regulator